MLNFFTKKNNEGILFFRTLKTHTVRLYESLEKILLLIQILENNSEDVKERKS